MNRTAPIPSYGDGCKITVTAKLSKIGDQAPYFNVTAEIRDPRVSRDRGAIACGCIHAEVLEIWPDLADLVAMHLSDIEGNPLYAAANGLYWIYGAISDDPTVQLPVYHGANGYQPRTPLECLQIAADYFRLPLPHPRQGYKDQGMAEDAAELADLVEMIRECSRPKRGDSPTDARKRAEEIMKRWCDSMRPRWAVDAAAIIAKYDLKVNAE